MPDLTVRDFQPTDLPAAAALFAGRHARDRERLPFLTAGLDRADVAERVLDETVFSRPGLDAAIAFEDGAAVGYLAGERMLLAPTYFASQYVEPHSVSIPPFGHAVAGSVDATTVYRALYRHLAERWVNAGLFVHTITIPAADPDTQEAWLSLGFGRKMTAAVRDLSPVEGVRAQPEIRPASVEDLDVVMRLVDSIAEHESSSPMFSPFVPETRAGLREHQREVLANPDNAHFVAYVAGEPIGIQTFDTNGFVPWQVPRANTIYLYQGAVLPGGRGGGIGTALLAHSVEWAREQGHERIALHFHAANWSGGPFWTGQGFQPVEYMMVRRIDSRISWAR